MTFRAALVGIFLAILINVWVIYSEYAIRSSLMTIAHLPVVAVFPLFILTAGCLPDRAFPGKPGLFLYYGGLYWWGPCSSLVLR